MQEPQLFALNFIDQGNDTRDIPARPIEARNKTICNRVERRTEDDRYRAGQSLGGACRVSTGSDNHGHLPTNEISRQ
jgi:hypothetical protein